MVSAWQGSETEANTVTPRALFGLRKAPAERQWNVPPQHREADLEPSLWQRSELARELRSLPPGQRKALHLEDWMVDIVEVITTVAIVMNDPADTRPPGTRIDQLFNSGQLPTAPPAEIENWTAQLTEDVVPRWAKQVRAASWRRFLRQLLGAAAYDRLAAALIADATHITRGLQQLARVLRPYALALDNCASQLPPNVIADLGLFKIHGTSLLRLLVALDAAMTDLLDLRFDFSAIKFDPDATDFDLAALVAEVGAILSTGTRATLDEISSRLVRKLAGAATALDVSEDGPAQAASSLIELIDRLLRATFPDDEVLAWLSDTGRTGDDYTHDKNGKERPTKRAQALCFIYGGQRADPSPFHELAATALVTARAKLQRIKHADAGTPEEAALVATLISTIEGFLTLAIRVGWLALPPENIEQLRQRLAA